MAMLKNKFDALIILGDRAQGGPCALFRLETILRANEIMLSNQIGLGKDGRYVTFTCQKPHLWAVLMLPDHEIEANEMAP